MESNEKKFICNQEGCNAAFSNNRKLINHTRKHNGERPFACDEPDCHKSYTNSSHLRRHKNVFHEKNVQKVKCLYDGCDRIFSNKSNLKKHYNRVHNTTVFPFTCTECNQSFRKKWLLHQHTFVHTGQATFSCDKCEACFATIIELNRHKRNHKTYTCICGNLFYRWSLLVQHRRTCDKCKPLCDVCKKVFQSNKNLKDHMLIHQEKINKELYVCTYENCNRQYYYKKNLRYHINAFHKQKVAKFPCLYIGCEKLLSNMNNLKRHMLKVHGNCGKETLERKPRKDKGVSRTDMAAKLSGLKNCLNLVVNTEEVKVVCENIIII